MTIHAKVDPQTCCELYRQRYVLQYRLGIPSVVACCCPLRLLFVTIWKTLTPPNGLLIWRKGDLSVCLQLELSCEQAVCFRLCVISTDDSGIPAFTHDVLSLASPLPAVDRSVSGARSTCPNGSVLRTTMIHSATLVFTFGSIEAFKVLAEGCWFGWVSKRKCVREKESEVSFPSCFQLEIV